MKYLFLISLLLSGCAYNVYSVAPTGNACRDLLLRQNNYCTSDDEAITVACSNEIKERCRPRYIIYK